MHPDLIALLAKHKLTAPVRREITVEPKVLDAAKGIVRFIASDETMDCYNEIVRLAGWRFTYFAKNAPFVNSHDYSDICNLLGQVITYGITGGALQEDVQFAITPKGDTLADWAFAMYRDGFLRACSVGFCPVRMASKWDQDKTELLQQITELRLDAAAAAKLACVHIEQEQIELSGCIIGANPNALAKSLHSIARAYKAGSIGEHAVQSLSAAIAASQPAALADGPAAAGAASPRAKAAIVAAIQKHL